jgi:DNA-binding transcriptional LysR family regulator
LKNNDVDIAFVHSPISDNNFTFQHCQTLEDFFVCSYDFDCSKIQTLQDLTKYRTLLLERESHSRKFLEANLLKYNVELRPKFELASLDLLIEFAKKNMGIICVSKQYIKKELENKELKIINLKEKLAPRAISLAYDKNSISKAAERFMECL